MCVLAVAWKAHPRWLLVAAANRDEFHDRPATPLHHWPDRDIIAGRDERAGGSWLALSPQGYFAAVTNRHGYGPPDPALASRGQLVIDLASNDAPPVTALDSFNPFNAMRIGVGDAAFLTNRPDAMSAPLPPGHHAISNGPIDPPWRKSTRLSAAIAAWLSGDAHSDVAPLFAALHDPTPPAHTDDDPAPIFVTDPVYGTRCSTLVLIDATGQGRIIERQFNRDAATVGEVELPFRWSV